MSSRQRKFVGSQISVVCVISESSTNKRKGLERLEKHNVTM